MSGEKTVISVELDWNEVNALVSYYADRIKGYTEQCWSGSVHEWASRLHTLAIHRDSLTDPNANITAEAA